MPLKIRSYPGGQAIVSRDLLGTGEEAQGIFSVGTKNSTTTVVASTTNAGTPLAALNLLRRRLTIYNDSNAVLYVKQGTGASSADYTIPIPAGGIGNWDPPEPYLGILTGAWASQNGQARVTEET